MSYKCSLSELYVLGGLDEKDRKEYSDHLETCPTCKTAVNELRKIVGHLSFNLDSYEDPPAGMRERVFEYIKANSERPIKEIQVIKKTNKTNYIKYVSIAAVLLLISSGVLLYQNNLLREKLTASHKTTKEQTQKTGNHIILGSLEREVDLKPAVRDKNGKVKGKAYLFDTDRNNYTLLVKADGLSKTVKRIYQVWLFSREIKSIGVLEPDEQGRSTFAALVPKNEEIKAVAVTEENSYSERPSEYLLFAALVPDWTLPMAPKAIAETTEQKETAKQAKEYRQPINGDGAKRESDDTDSVSDNNSVNPGNSDTDKRNTDNSNGQGNDNHQPPKQDDNDNKGDKNNSDINDNDKDRNGLAIHIDVGLTEIDLRVPSITGPRR